VVNVLKHTSNEHHNRSALTNNLQ